MVRTAIVLGATLVGSPVQAGLSCDDLWGARNAVYAEAGYCFKTERAIRAFGGNRDCRFTDINDVPLSANDRRKIAQILEQERAARCPR
jgi:hypothetical protein